MEAAPLPGSSARRSSVLLVEDDEALLRVQERGLERAGFRVVGAPDGDAAVKAMTAGAFDLIISDIDMPKMDGITLLQRVRSFDPDVPVILLSGGPSLDNALRAMENGALKLLLKPVDLPSLVHVAEEAVRALGMARLRKRALDQLCGLERMASNPVGLGETFRAAVETLHIAFQPIVSWSERTVFGYEALLRSNEPALPDAAAMLQAAERLGRVHVLGRAVRSKALAPLDGLPSGALLFLNLHPQDLADEELYCAHGRLAQVSDRVVLEITERASLHGIADVEDRIRALRRMGFRIALDDLGAGYAGLSCFAQLEPDIVKLDMALVRDLHKAPTKQTLVRTMLGACRELGIAFTAEGIEAPEERDALARLGCDLMQGYLFSRPGEAFPKPTF